MSFFILATLTAFFTFPQITLESMFSGAVPIAEARNIPPVFEKIAFCESSNSHFDEDGNVKRGEINKYDIGKYQINAKYWQELADKLGHDLHTEEGNEAMALELYKRYGTDPWNSSKKCWSK